MLQEFANLLHELGLLPACLLVRYQSPDYLPSYLSTHVCATLDLSTSNLGDDIAIIETSRELFGKLRKRELQGAPEDNLVPLAQVVEKVMKPVTDPTVAHIEHTRTEPSHQLYTAELCGGCPALIAQIDARIGSY